MREHPVGEHGQGVSDAVTENPNSSSDNGKTSNGKLHGMIEQYLDAVIEDQTEEQSIMDVVSQDGQGVDVDPQANVDPAGPIRAINSTTRYQGQMRTTTGIVKIMRESGNVDSADLLEKLHQTQDEAKQLLDKLRDLHKRKTGSFSVLKVRSTNSER